MNVVPFKPSTQAEEIAAALEMLSQPGDVREMRVLVTRRRTVSGYYDDPRKLARDAAQWDKKAPGIYVTINPVKPELLARANNRPRDYAEQTTADNDILRRAWLPIDFDPVRPAGISSTDVEHEAALDRAALAQLWLTEQGFPDGVLASSGNGAHLLYALDLPNDAASRDLVKAVLEMLSLQFSDQEVAADVTNFNAARIWKLYGTTAAKGEDLPERPHRQARVIQGAGSLQLVPAQLLAAVAAMLPERPQPEPRTNGSAGSFDIREWISLHRLPVEREGPWNGGYRWVLNPCPFDAGHDDDSAVIVQFPSGAISAKCHHNGCSGKGWRELRELYEPYEKRWQASDAPVLNGVSHNAYSAPYTVQTPGTEPETPQPATPERWTPKPLSALQSQMEEADWQWYGFLAPGNITLFTGLWKSGKTTLLSYLMKALDGSAETFGGFAVKGARVLIVSEEHERHWATRRDALGIGDHVHIINRPFMRRADHRNWLEFLEHLVERVAVGGYEMVVIDSLHNMWPVGDENSASEVTRALTPLTSIAELGASVLLLGHPAKADAGEGRATRGSGASGGLVDIILEMRRYDAEHRDDTRRVLTSFSRFEATPTEVVWQWDKGEGYSLLGTKGETRARDRYDILAAVLSDVPPGLTVDEVVERWPETEVKPSDKTVSRELYNAFSKGLLDRFGAGARNKPYTYWRKKPPTIINTSQDTSSS